jgi:TetR/AcrR family transcriptional repressor of nem operon
LLVARLFQQPPALCEAISALYVECDHVKGSQAAQPAVDA